MRSDLGWKNGKRQRKLVYAATASAVREKMTQLLRDRDLGMLPETGTSPTIAAFLEGWLTSVKASLRVRSFERYDSIIKRHLAPVIGRTKLEKLTPAHVQSLLDAKLATGLSPRSVLAIRIVLGAALKQAVRWQMLPA